MDTSPDPKGNCPPSNPPSIEIQPPLSSHVDRPKPPRSTEIGGRGLNLSIRLADLRFPSLLGPSSLSSLTPSKRRSRERGVSIMHPTHFAARSHTHMLDRPIRHVPGPHQHYHPINTRHFGSVRPVDVAFDAWFGGGFESVQHRRMNDGGTEGRTPLYQPQPDCQA